jgi:hypothetical protein
MSTIYIIVTRDGHPWKAFDNEEDAYATIVKDVASGELEVGSSVRDLIFYTKRK